MDEQTSRQLVRQLKILNFWVTLFGSLFVVSLIIIGILLFKLITFVNDTSAKLEALQQKTQDSLDVRKQVCDSNTLGAIARRTTDICNQ